MKKITLSALAVVTMSTFGFAGGDIEPVPAPVMMEETGPFYIGLGLSAVSTRGADADFNIFDVGNGSRQIGKCYISCRV